MVKRRLFSFLFWLVKCYFGTGFSYASLWIRGEWYDFSWPITEHQSVANLKAMYTFDTLETEFVSLLLASLVENVWCAFLSAMEEGFYLIFLLYTLLVELFSGRGSPPLNSKWKEEARYGYERKTAGSSWDAGKYILFTDLQIDRWFSITTLN